MTEQTETGAVESVETGTPVETTTPAPSFNEAVDATMSAVYDKLNPPRSATGQFAPRNPAETAPGATGTETPDQAQTTAVETPPASIDAPQSWSAEAKAKWAALPPDVQAYIAKRESESHEAITRQGTQVKSYEPIAKALEPVRQALTQNGIAEADYVNRLVQAEIAFQRDPAGTLLHFAKEAGIDLAKLASPQAENTDYVDPQIAELKGTINNLTQRLSQYETRQHQTELTEAQRALEAFQSEKDEGGNPKRPHFEAVRQEMARLIQANPKLSLGEAYDKAVWGDPNIRQSILSEQRKADEEKARKEAEKKALDAKRQRSLNVKPGPGSTPAKPRSMEEIMSEAYDRVHAA